MINTYAPVSTLFEYATKLLKEYPEARWLDDTKINDINDILSSFSNETDRFICFGEIGDSFGVFWAHTEEFLLERDFMRWEDLESVQKNILDKRIRSVENEVAHLEYKLESAKKRLAHLRSQL